MRFREWLNENILGQTVFELLDNLNGRILVFFDTETTGLIAKPYHQITQIAAMAVEAETGNKLNSFEKDIKLNQATLDRIEFERRNPDPDPANWGIEKVLNYNQYDPAKADSTELEMLQQFEEWLRGIPNPLLVAHNAGFDMKMINTSMKRNGMKPINYKVFDFWDFVKLYLEPILLILKRIGVVEAETILQKMWNEKRQKYSFSQESLGKGFNVANPTSHVAMSDCQQLYNLYTTIMKFIQKHLLDINGKEPEFQHSRWRKHALRPQER